MDWTLDIPLAISRGQFDYRPPSDSTSIASNFLGPQRLVEPGISLTDLPVIDIVIISHNHYDHLDRKTVSALVEQQPANPPLFLVPLGLKDWFADIGINENVIELDWWQSHRVGDWQLNAVPVQHWSRRGLFDTNKTLWAGWVIEAPEQKMFFAGDTGYSCLLYTSPSPRD